MTTTLTVPAAGGGGGTTDAVARFRSGGYAYPEEYGTGVGGGDTTGATDTPAIQAAANTGKTVVLQPGTIYYLNAEITSSASNFSLSVMGMPNASRLRPTLQAASGFTGFMLRVPLTGGYFFENLVLIGRGGGLSGAGVYGIGTDQVASAGAGHIKHVRVQLLDIGIYFSSSFQHPLQMLIDEIYGQGFLTGGIWIGDYTSVSSVGESEWTVKNVALTQTGSVGVSASSVVVTPNTTDGTTANTSRDFIAWDATTNLGKAGWMVMRSANGTTAWHCPPNWVAGAAYNSGSFMATKTAGETWTYAVVRMTVGLLLRRGKSVEVDCQAERFGIGIMPFTWSNGIITKFYAEHRDASPPYPNLAAVFCYGGNVNILNGHSDQESYAVIAYQNATVKIATIDSVTNKWAAIGINNGVSGTVQKVVADTVNLNTTPLTYLPMNGAANETNFFGPIFNSTTFATELTINGQGPPGISLYKGNTFYSRFGLRANNEVEITLGRAQIILPSKIHETTLRNNAQTTGSVDKAYTPIMTIDLTGSAATVGLGANYMCRNASNPNAQVIRGHLDIIVNAYNTNIAKGSVTDTNAKFASSGTINSIAWDIQSGLATGAVVAGGSGYTNNDTLTVPGGTLATDGAAATFKATVSGGVVTALAMLTPGAYTTPPTGTLTLTGGSGTGCTATATWANGVLRVRTDSTYATGFLFYPYIHSLEGSFVPVITQL